MNRFRIYSALLTVFVSLVLLACKGNEKSGTADTKSQMDISVAYDFNWTHSHEEDQGEEKFFRHEPWEFPPSRGRVAFKLLEDKTLKYFAIGAADMPEELEGTWSISGDILRMDLKGKEAKPGYSISAKLIRVEKDLIILKYQ